MDKRANDNIFKKISLLDFQVILRFGLNKNQENVQKRTVERIAKVYSIE